jgi:hypothetical protein
MIFTALSPLPPGITLSPGGTFSGTPTAAFSGNVVIQLTDGVDTVVQTIAITINPPQRAIPPITETVNIQEFFTPTITALTPPTIVPLFFKPTITAITANTPISVTELFTPTIAPAIDTKTELFTPFIEQLSTGGFDTAIALPLGTTGLTQIINAATDDANIATGDIGFDLDLYGGNRRASLFVSSNSFVTFLSGSNAYNSFSNTYPGMGLFVGAADRSWRSVWAGSDGPNSYRIRWEGYNSSSTGPPSNSVWEMTFFGDGVIMLVTGAMAFTSGYTSITDGLGGNATAYTLISDSSWVFEPDGVGGFTIQVGSYSI